MLSTDVDYFCPSVLSTECEAHKGNGVTPLASLRPVAAEVTALWGNPIRVTRVRAVMNNKNESILYFSKMLKFH